LFTQVLMMDGEPERKAKIVDTGPNEHFRLGLVYNTSDLNKVHGIYWLHSVGWLGVFVRQRIHNLSAGTNAGL